MFGVSMKLCALCMGHLARLARQALLIQTMPHCLQATILDAVLPVWSNPHMASTSVAGSGIVTHILKKCTEETKPLPAAASRAQQRAEMTPDPAIVQQCVEMGFTEARVQEALRRVRPRAKALVLPLRA